MGTNNSAADVPYFCAWVHLCSAMQESLLTRPRNTTRPSWHAHGRSMGGSVNTFGMCLGFLKRGLGPQGPLCHLDAVKIQKSRMRAFREGGRGRSAARLKSDFSRDVLQLLHETQKLRKINILRHIVSSR